MDTKDMVENTTAQKRTEFSNTNNDFKLFEPLNIPEGSSIYEKKPVKCDQHPPQVASEQIEEMNSRFRSDIARRGKHFNWHQDIEDGKVGERVVKRYLEEKFGKKNVKDLSDDKFFQHGDIDFAALNEKNHKIIFYEVKTDLQANNTGNIPFETLSNGNPGCLARSAADYVVYYTLATLKNPKNHFYLIDLPKWRDVVEKSNSKSPGVFRWNMSMGQGAKGHLYRIQYLIDENIAEQVY